MLRWVSTVSRRSRNLLHIWLSWQLVTHHLLCLIHLDIAFLTLTFAPIHGVSYDYTDGPAQSDVNLSGLVVSLPGLTSQAPIMNVTSDIATRNISRRRVNIERIVPDGSDVPRDSPTALVIASSIAAVSILVFFVIAYLWHTHQLDSRARKLAIRLAADAEHGMRLRNSRPQISREYSRATPKEKPRVLPEPPPKQTQYLVLSPDEERGHSSDGGRSSVGVSESESGDNDDTFEPIQFPPIGERGRIGTRGGRGSHRKFNKSRKSSSGASLDKRHSSVTDKEILTHFASRRHSTFFI